MAGLWIGYKSKVTGSTWQDISANVVQNKLTYSAEENELSEFSLILNEPVDSGDAFIYPVPGDEIVVCETNLKTKVLADSLAGRIVESQSTIKAWDKTTSQWVCQFAVTVGQPDPSSDEVILDYKTSTALSTILDAILLTNTFSDLSGVVNSRSYPKYDLLASDINVESIDFLGSPIQALTETLKSIGYKWKMGAFSEPDSSNVINLVYQIIIYDKTGLTPGRGSAWSSGITDATLKNFQVQNPAYSSATHNGLDAQPQYFWTEKDFSIKSHTRNVKNYVKLFGVVEGLYTGIVNRYAARSEVNFNVGSKAKDITAAGRKVYSPAVTVPSTSSITIRPEKAQMLVIDQSRLTDQKLKAWLSDSSTWITTYYTYIDGNGDTVSTQSHPIPFTISGVIVTFDYAIIETVAINDHFEAVHTVELLPENTPDADLPTYYALKHCKPTELGYVTFNNSTAPTMEQVFSCVFETLSDYESKEIFESSVRSYGLKHEKKEFELVLTDDKIEQIIQAYEVTAEPIQEINVISLRPEPLQLGWVLGVNLTDLVNKTFVVESIKSSYKHPTGQDGRPLIEQKIKLSSYRDNLKDLLNSFKNPVNLKQAVLAELKNSRVSNAFGFEFSLTDRELLPKLIFVSDQGGSYYNLYKADIDGSNIEQLTFYTDTLIGSKVDIRSDGQKISYGYNGNIWQYDTISTISTQITNSGDNVSASYSPITNNLGFLTDRSGAWRIAFFAEGESDLLGDTPTTLVNTTFPVGGAAKGGSFSFTNDGLSMAYSAGTDGVGAGVDIWKIDIDDTNNSVILPGAGNSFNPDYNTDNSAFAYNHPSGSYHAVWKYDTVATLLASGAFENTEARYSRSDGGVYIYYLGGATLAIKRMLPDGTGQTDIIADGHYYGSVVEGGIY